LNIPDHFSESLETVFRVKNTKTLLCVSGSGILDPESVIRDDKILIRIRNTARKLSLFVQIIKSLQVLPIFGKVYSFFSF
jgi:hypothetical protein